MKFGDAIAKVFGYLGIIQVLFTIIVSPFQ